jgi:hypothetical protein
MHHANRHLLGHPARRRIRHHAYRHLPGLRARRFAVVDRGLKLIDYNLAFVDWSREPIEIQASIVASSPSTSSRRSWPRAHRHLAVDRGLEPIDSLFVDRGLESIDNLAVVDRGLEPIDNLVVDRGLNRAH